MFRRGKLTNNKDFSCSGSSTGSSTNNVGVQIFVNHRSSSNFSKNIKEDFLEGTYIIWKTLADMDAGQM